jgi:type I restriction enzyme S subunit
MIHTEKLGKLATIVRGSSPRPMGDPRYFGGKIPWVKISDLSASDGRTLFSTKEGVTQEGMKKSRLVRKGDLIVSNSGSVGKPIFMGVDGCIHDGFLTFLDISNSIIKEWIYWYFVWYKDRIQSKANTGTQLNLNTTIVKNLDIPLPPLETQKKIAAILDKADAIRQANKEILAKYDELAQSVFLDMFGDPVRNEKGWEKSKTIDYCDCIVPGRDKPKSFSGEIPWVTTNDLNYLSDTFKSIDNIGLTKEEIATVKAKVIPIGSVIMTCVGDLGVVSINQKEMVVNQQLHTFQCNDKINNIFLMYSLSFQKGYMYKMASTTTVPYMNKTVANNTPTICPPIGLQDKFAKVIVRIEKQKKLAQQALDKSEELFNSLLQRAFKGELVWE